MSTKIKNQSNRINRIKYHGRWLPEKEEIKAAAAAAHYSNLFTTLNSNNNYGDDYLRCVPRKVTDDMNANLIKPISKEEIKEDTFQLGSLKSHRPDGFSGVFFQNNWDHVGDQVCLAVQEFFDKELNQTLITLIPKIHAPKSLPIFILLAYVILFTKLPLKLWLIE